MLVGVAPLGRCWRARAWGLLSRQLLRRSAWGHHRLAGAAPALLAVSARVSPTERPSPLPPRLLTV